MPRPPKGACRVGVSLSERSVLPLPCAAPWKGLRAALPWGLVAALPHVTYKCHWRPAVPPGEGRAPEAAYWGPGEGPGRAGTRLTLYMLQSPGWLRTCERRGLLLCVSQGTCRGTQSGRLSPCRHRGRAPSPPATSRPERPGRAPGGGRGDGQMMDGERHWEGGRGKATTATPGLADAGEGTGGKISGDPCFPSLLWGRCPMGGPVWLQGRHQTHLLVRPAGGPPGPRG